MLEDISDLSGHETPHGKVRQVIPAEAVEAAAVFHFGACLQCGYIGGYHSIYCRTPAAKYDITTTDNTKTTSVSKEGIR